MKYLGVVNPISGGNDKDEFLRYFEETCHFYGIETCLFRTTGESDMEKLKKAVEEHQPDRLIAAGGDGTFALTALASMEAQIPIGVVPLGSANGMAKELGVNQNVEFALDDILKSEYIKAMDIVCINGEHHCIHLGDIGLNARVVKAFDADANRGMLTYGKHLAAELNQSEPFNYKIEADGKTYEGSCVMLAVANGRKFGTGVPLTNSGNPFDGRFELAIVEDVNVETIIKAGLSVVEGLVASGNVDRVIHATKAKIHFDTPELLQADGEVIGEYKELDITMISSGFRLITTRANPYLS